MATGLPFAGSRPKWRNWQTRRTQNPVPLGACGFDSHLRHRTAPAARVVLPRLPLGSAGSVSRHLERAAVALVPLALVPALGAAGGGFQPDTWVWAGALAAWGAAVAVTVTDHPGALRVGWPWLLGAATFLLWTLASTLWSVEP